MEHIMHLQNDPFVAITEGRKSIEARLNDEKRRNMNVGDEVTFINRKTDEKIKCMITNLYTYDNFEELYKHHDKLSLGYNEDDIASPADMNIYYPMENQMKNGVVAIEFNLEK